ncbi:hypothetical protein [Flavobacterium sp. LB2P74]|uniref:hypothetical protein n=1 Tax=Flavobacterium sp. LB2P74 TaxID=3401717 RepID=UPI003AAEE503
MVNNILIEIRKDIFYKKRKYTIEVDGTSQGVLTLLNSKKMLSLEAGKHIIAIQCDDYLVENEIVVKTDTLERFYIKPNVSLELLKGVTIGFSVFIILFFFYSYFYLNTKISIPIVITLLFPILFVIGNKKNNANFVIEK